MKKNKEHILKDTKNNNKKIAINNIYAIIFTQIYLRRFFMGRAHEVRAASMAATAAKKTALYNRASKEIYMAAKSGDPDPNSNLALRAAIEKYKGQNISKDVINRAIEKAKGGSAESYIEGRYEGFGQGNCYIIIDTLTDNANRAYTNVRTAVNKKGGHLGTPGSVAFNFEQLGVITFETSKSAEELEELLIMGDVDLRSVVKDDDYAEILVAPEALDAAKEVLNGEGISEFQKCEKSMIPNEYVTLEGEDLEKFQQLLDILDEVEDVQAVYHNVENA